MKSKITTFVVMASLLLSYEIALAKKNEPTEQNIPPQEIFDACVNKAIGESCSYTDNKSKTLSGKCVKDTRVVVCIPEPEPTHKE